MIVDVNLNRSHDIFTIVNLFSNFNYDEELTVNIIHSRNKFIAVGVYPVLCSIINEARQKGLDVVLNFDLPENCNQLSYAERMNFLACLGCDYCSPFGRNSSSGRFIEITNIPKNSYGMNINLMAVFQTDFALDEESAYDLSFLIGELYCNSSIHSRGENGCYFYCQKFPSKNYLELYIVDSGIGIVNTMNINKEYNELNESELLPLSLEFGEGSGNGRGHGLYFVSEYIKRNNGEMLYISGKNHIFIKNNTITSHNNNNYNGVILRLRFRFNPSVTTRDLMREKHYTNV